MAERGAAPVARQRNGSSHTPTPSGAAHRHDPALDGRMLPCPPAQRLQARKKRACKTHYLASISPWLSAPISLSVP